MDVHEGLDRRRALSFVPASPFVDTRGAVCTHPRPTVPFKRTNITIPGVFLKNAEVRTNNTNHLYFLGYARAPSPH